MKEWLEGLIGMIPWFYLLALIIFSYCCSFFFGVFTFQFRFQMHKSSFSTWVLEMNSLTMLFHAQAEHGATFLQSLLHFLLSPVAPVKLPARKSASRFNGTGIFRWLRTWKKWLWTFLFRRCFIEPSIVRSTSRSSERTSSPSVSRIAESESDKTTTAQSAISSCRKDKNNFWIAKSSSVVLDVSSFEGTLSV